MSAALDRLAASRERLRAAMTPAPTPPGGPVQGRNSWLDKFAELPMVHAVSESLATWWVRHPVRPLARFAGEASSAALQPVAQRNPLLLVAGAAVAGAAVAWLRPWRWIFQSAVLAGLLPQLASRMVSRLPIESWISMIGSVLATNRAAQPNSPHATHPEARAA